VKRWPEWELKPGCKINAVRVEAFDQSVFNDFFSKVGAA